ncbi:TPA: hypothetical protein N0F65_001425 [Lagenidium giganteum]|uniref:Glucosidase 2 subunit beta n=1 Tax=Lagenidium giganteum TaxID=4803 RepID=A0AAV2Z2L3_9STRA|nr:TPA: hypothetical protein N0F65_001425 [Lagenidium giganteum]
MVKDHNGPKSLAMRRTMIKSTVGHVRRSSYDLPDAKNPGHVYGYEIQRDPEGAGEVIGKWVQAVPSPAAKSGRSFIETNRQALAHGCISATEARQFANAHPDILIRQVRKASKEFVPTNDVIYGIKSKVSEDVTGLIQARFTDFSKENTDYPDLSSMKIKGKLPMPRDTVASLGKDVRLHPRTQEQDHHDLFKMSKFRNSSVTATAVLGVGPGRQELYRSPLQCSINGEPAVLQLAKVNDDYCDCDDGVDEPGTAACSHLSGAMFHCENGGFFPTSIHSSRVNDGICDCCDGSDEVDHQCANTCVEKAAVNLKAAKERLQSVEAGYKKRQAIVDGEVAKFFSSSNELDQAADKTLASLQQLRERVLVHKHREERKELKMRVEHARKKQAQEDEQQLKTCDGGEDCSKTGDDSAAEAAADANAKTPANAEGEAKTSDAAPADDSFEELNAERVMTTGDADIADVEEVPAVELSPEEEGEIHHQVRSTVELADGSKISLADYLRMEHQQTKKLKGSRTVEDMRREDFLGPLFNGDEASRKQLGVYALRSLGMLCSPVRAVVEAVTFVPRTLWEVASSSELLKPHIDKLPDLPRVSSIMYHPTFRSLGGGRYHRWCKALVWGGGVMWDAPIVAYKYMFPKLNQELTLPEAESLRKILEEIDSDIEKMKKEKATRAELKDQDFGPDRAYFALKDKCINKKIEKYEYKFCPFKDVKQDYTNLGKWEGWGSSKDGDSSAKDYSVMEFTRGQHCWSGPDRSVRVSLTCAHDEEILSVDEPSTCVYRMTVATPCACSSAELARAQADVAFWSQGSAVQ